jgi:anaerobic selenocysteine-containing dehydrogenase
MGLGGNFLSATPDTEMVAAGLRKCELTVQISTKLNRSHLVTGKTALILPCLGRTERDVQASGAQFVTTENSMSVVEASEGRLSPPSKNVKSETSIILELAEAVFRDQPEKLNKADWKAMRENYDVIREHIARVVPGFADFNQRIKKERFFYLPNGVRDASRFDNDVKKGKFTVHPIPVWDLKQDQYLLMTFRSHDQFNTTIYGQNDRYRGVHGGRRVVFMNKDDIRDAGFKAGMAIDLTSVYGTENRQVKKFKVIEYKIPRGCVAAYYPETNPLVPIHSVADKSNTPAYKSVVVQLAAHA